MLAVEMSTVGTGAEAERRWPVRRLRQESRRADDCFRQGGSGLDKRELSRRDGGNDDKVERRQRLIHCHWRALGVGGGEDGRQVVIWPRMPGGDCGVHGSSFPVTPISQGRRKQGLIRMVGQEVSVA